jgi:two-component system, OmpR family, response regulator
MSQYVWRGLDIFRHIKPHDFFSVFRHIKPMKAVTMTLKPAIAIVEDDRVIAQLVEKALRQNGFSTVVVQDGRALDRVLRETHIDLILLDVMLPGEDGLSIAKRLSAEQKHPIIMMTALGEETDRIVGLELGADDYVTKPFSTRELIARIRAVLRRMEGHKSTSVEAQTFRFAGYELDYLQRVLTDADATQIELTGAELQLLAVFCENPRTVISRESLLQKVHLRPTGADVRSIDTLVSRLRNKLETDPKNPSLFKTVRLGGYLFTPAVEIL